MNTPPPPRIVGQMLPGEAEDRAWIRKQKVPPSKGPDPNIYTMPIVPGKTHLFKKGKYDPWNSWYDFQSEIPMRRRYFYPYIRNGDVVVDAGATWGNYTLPAAVLGAHVHAFEPNYNIFPELRANVSLNKLEDQITLYQMGLSDTDKHMEYEDLKDIHLITLDSLDLEQCDFIKIDVEGQEADLLEGARKTIAKFAPIILAEAHLQYDPDMSNRIAKIIMTTRSSYRFIAIHPNAPTATITGFFYNTDNFAGRPLPPLK